MIEDDRCFYERQLIKTDDGSHSLYLPGLDETYHNRRGALTESRHIYIDWGLDHFRNYSYPVKILEIGFGTGLNALLSLEFATLHELKVEYHTIEPYPLSHEEWSKLNYAIDEHQLSQLKLLHESSFETKKSTKINQYFEVYKYKTRIQELALPNEYFDLVYFDAFAPNKQNEMWDIDILDKVRNSMRTPSALVTYCSQGQFKRDLKRLGFQSQHPSGPLGKKEMTIARLLFNET